MSEQRRILWNVGGVDLETLVPTTVWERLFSEAVKASPTGLKAVSSQQPDLPLEGGITPTVNERSVQEREANSKFASTFHDDKETGLVTLKATPSPEGKSKTAHIADALLLILYGFRTVRSEREVPVGKLLDAAHHSGFPDLDRTDRVIDSHHNFIVIEGTKRGKTYQINPQGMAHAEKLLAQMPV